MKKVNIVTSFNETILKDTAVHLLKSTKENLDTDINLTCYYHDCKIDAYSLPDYTYKNLHDVKDHESFLKDMQNMMVQKKVRYLTMKS